MNACIKMILAATILFSANFASATIPNFSTIQQPTAEQCVKIRADLEDYIAYVNAWLAAQPLKKQKLLKPIVNYAISEAKKLVNKLCPAPTGWDNKFSANSPYACNALDSSSVVVRLGIDSSLGLVSVAAPFKTVCLSFNACLNIASQKFLVTNAQQTAECADPLNQNVLHLTDAEVQTKVNAIP